MGQLLKQKWNKTVQNSTAIMNKLHKSTTGQVSYPYEMKVLCLTLTRTIRVDQCVTRYL